MARARSSAGPFEAGGDVGPREMTATALRRGSRTRLTAPFRFFSGAAPAGAG